MHSSLTNTKKKVETLRLKINDMKAALRKVHEDNGYSMVMITASKQKHVVYGFLRSDYNFVSKTIV